ncbi:FMN-dependent NADH-azoreductase [Alginatibacterium sediminis]|uniref:FMN dependent NADH:quinone oxidoreductase n=1 Tax=Alginatibacterium sediminis TaxID=2164068 RepID=A0A420ENQ1_9ALTE|nr:NAD(P)H-dependent oxidoreductase [Alginatibacterium sediminis]RKF22224.1 FMN-dependent NADH-azoreductase [Alginatibacterium sediminis]
MKNLLRIDSSLFGENGVSSQLASHLQVQLEQKHPDLETQLLNFSQSPVPHLAGDFIGALSTELEQRSQEQQQLVAYADDLIAQLKNADALIITAPMYNFTIPSMLKSWFDYIARAGETFSYTEQGPKGLLANIPVYVISTRGGKHSGAAYDTMETYIRTMLNFVGLDQVHVIYAEGLAMGDEARESGINQAQLELNAVI